MLIIADIATTTLFLFAVHEANFHDLNTARFVATIQCESGFKENAISPGGISVGAVQIHLAAHPDITRKEAMDGFWSIAWAAEQWSLGKENEWDCYTMKYGYT